MTEISERRAVYSGPSWHPATRLTGWEEWHYFEDGHCRSGHMIGSWNCTGDTEQDRTARDRLIAEHRSACPDLRKET